ncbi:MAG: ABC transporter permease [Deltaproteobacteria bacterium]|nr:ABC transporter permease [Deltaproteobacteria bacterium]
MLLKMAWRNLWRNRRRTLLTISAIGLGLAILIAMVSFMQGMMEMMVEQIARSSMGHIQIHNPEYLHKKSVKLTMSGGSQLVKVVEDVPGVAYVSPRLLFTGSIRSSRSSSIQVVRVIAVDPQREKRLSGLADKVVEGGFVTEPPGADDPETPARLRGRKGILLGVKLAKRLKVDLGSKVRLDTAGFRGSTSAAAFYVTGILKVGSDAMDNGMVMVSLKDMQKVTGAGDRLHELTVIVNDVGAIKEMVGRIKAAIDKAGGPAAFGPVDVLPWWKISPGIKQMLDMSDAWNGILYMLMLAILSAGVLTTMFMVVYERTREFGVRLALGTRPGSLFVGVMAEALFMALLASALGLLCGGLIVAYLVNIGIDMSSLVGGWEFAGIFFENVYKGSYAPEVFVEPTLVVFIGTVLLSLWPSMRVARMKAIDAIREGGVTG